MKKLIVSQSLVEVEAIQSILEQEGIRCTIKNQHTSNLAGEVPFAEVFPELWLIDDEEETKAQEILTRLQRQGTAEGEKWRCSKCGESHSVQFTSCWNCGTDRP